MKLFISYQKKIFTSPLIYISIIGIALLSYMGMPKIDLEFGVIHAFDIMIELSVYNKIMMILSVFHLLRLSAMNIITALPILYL